MPGRGPAQAAAARAYIEALTAKGAYGGAPIVTEVEPEALYHPAEVEHQRYFELNPHAGYCMFVVAPKVHKFAAHFPDLDEGT